MYSDRPWLKNYTSGIPANIDADAFPSVVDFMQQSCEQYAKLIAFSCYGVDMTYAELDKRSTEFAAYLQHRGLRPGDRFAIMMPNLLQFPIAVFGAFKAGLVVVNTNPLYTHREMKHQFTSSGVRGILIVDNFAHHLEKILPETEIDVVITSSIGELLGFMKGRAINFVLKNIQGKVPKFSISNSVKFKQALKEGKKYEWTKVPQDGQTVILHQYTGGTTGVSKGAELTNRNMVANMLQVRAIMLPSLEEGKEIALCPLPLYHIFAFTLHCCALLGYGCRNILIINPRDLSTVVGGFKKYDISLMSGVNTLFNALTNNKGFNDLDFNGFKISIAGGMALQQSVQAKWQEITNSYIAEGYGLTESSPVASVNRLDGLGAPGSVGLPAPSTEMKIVLDDGSHAPVGEVGEIRIKGPQIMKGYYQRPEETAAVLQDGWLCTGDIGKMNEDGYFFVVDRKKDMINVSGFNVYPNEIEEVAAAHPKVLEAAAIGVQDDNSGESVKLFVVKSDDSLKEKELMSYLEENLIRYKLPKKIEFRNDLPKSNVGKILRRSLREETK